mmetsp:Transcript_11635/g.33246  ORF Transcript_11635/g.33246 Transcript_11635/m.33246 type:complete len:261 (+) Transcript_11635:153-935(+)
MPSIGLTFVIPWGRHRKPNSIKPPKRSPGMSTASSPPSFFLLLAGSTLSWPLCTTWSTLWRWYSSASKRSALSPWIWSSRCSSRKSTNSCVHPASLNGAANSAVPSPRAPRSREEPDLLRERIRAKRPSSMAALWCRNSFINEDRWRTRTRQGVLQTTVQVEAGCKFSTGPSPKHWCREAAPPTVQLMRRFTCSRSVSLTPGSWLYGLRTNRACLLAPEAWLSLEEVESSLPRSSTPKSAVEPPSLGPTERPTISQAVFP